jgi:hypothetical protein
VGLKISYIITQKNPTLLTFLTIFISYSNVLHLSKQRSPSLKARYFSLLSYLRSLAHSFFFVLFSLIVFLSNDFHLSKQCIFFPSFFFDLYFLDYFILFVFLGFFFSSLSFFFFLFFSLNFSSFFLIFFLSQFRSLSISFFFLRSLLSLSQFFFFFVLSFNFVFFF